MTDRDLGIVKDFLPRIRLRPQAKHVLYREGLCLKAQDGSCEPRGVPISISVDVSGEDPTRININAV